MDIDNDDNYFSFGYMKLCQPKEFRTPYGPLVTDNIIRIMSFIIDQRYKNFKAKIEKEEIQFEQSYPRMRFLQRFGDFSACFAKCVEWINNGDFGVDQPEYQADFTKMAHEMMVHSYKILYLVPDYKMSEYLEAFLKKLDEYYKELILSTDGEPLIA